MATDRSDTAHIIFSVCGISQANLATSALLTILVNSLIVGINEEVMLRGLMFSGLSSRVSFWKACLLTTVIFGSMHMLNYFSTGELKILQSVATMGVGFLLLAIRVGMGSIIPAIIIHWLWGFGTAMTASVKTITGGTVVQIVPLFILVAPILFAFIGIAYLRGYSKRLAREDMPA